MKINLKATATVEELLPKAKIIDFLENSNIVHDVENIISEIKKARTEKRIIKILMENNIGYINSSTNEFLTHCAYDSEQICLFKIYFYL